MKPREGDVTQGNEERYQREAERDHRGPKRDHVGPEGLGIRLMSAKSGTTAVRSKPRRRSAETGGRQLKAEKPNFTEFQRMRTTQIDVTQETRERPR